MKVKANFTYVCGKTGKGKQSGKEWYQVTVLTHDPDETFDVFTTEEVFSQLKGKPMFEFEGVFTVAKWSNNMQIRQLVDLV